MRRKPTHADPSRQLTLRGFSAELEAELRKIARQEGISTNQAALRLLEKGAGLSGGKRRDVVGNSLDALIGSWTAHEANRFSKAVRDFEAVDDSLWR